MPGTSAAPRRSDARLAPISPRKATRLKPSVAETSVAPGRVQAWGREVSATLVEVIMRIGTDVATRADEHGAVVSLDRTGQRSEHLVAPPVPAVVAMAFGSTC